MRVVDTAPSGVLLLFVLAIVFVITFVILEVDSHDAGSAVRGRPVMPRPRAVDWRRKDADGASQSAAAAPSLGPWDST